MVAVSERFDENAEAESEFAFVWIVGVVRFSVCCFAVASIHLADRFAIPQLKTRVGGHRGRSVTLLSVSVLPRLC